MVKSGADAARLIRTFITPDQSEMMPISEHDYELPASRSSGLLRDALRIPVEQMVSRHYGREWRVSAFRDMGAFGYHPSALLSDGSASVFVKLSEAANGLEQFAVEMAGLRLLAEQSGVLIPFPIGSTVVDGAALLVLEGVQEVARGAAQWRDIGRALAQIHQVKGSFCGLERQGYFGPLYQDNRPISDWLSFYAERRLWPRLAGAIDSGNIPSETIRLVETLIARLPRLNIPEVEPSLLHGDAQQNNFISTEQGAVVIDPAVYYGNPEIDLAFLDNYAPVPADVYAGYAEITPIDPGFTERRDLWRVPAYLAGVSVSPGGGMYLPMLIRAVGKYL
jgi:protein-ribulosamine 3-kinase